MFDTLPLKLKSNLGPALLLNHIFGLFPYDPETLHLKYWSTIISIILPSSITISLYINLAGGNRSNFDAFILATFQTVSIVPWITTSFCFLKTFRIRSEIAKIIASVTMVENRFKFRGRQRSIFMSSFMYDAVFRTLMSSCASYYAFMYVKNALGPQGKDYLQPFLIRFFGIYLTLFLQNIYDLQFLAFVKHMTFWFETLEKRLTTSAVGLLIECYKDLSVACRALERAFSVQNFLSLSSCFLLNMIDFYIVYVNRRHGLLEPVSLQVLFRMGLRLYQMVTLVFYVDQLHNQARAFDDSLMAIIHSDHTKTLENDARVRAHLSRKNMAKFTAGNMFEVDSMLLHSVAAITINYLVILIQFGGSDQKI